MSPERRDWLLKLGFAGVQDFIAQARKVRDLAAGSRLIQKLAKELALAHRDQLVLPTHPERACPHQLLFRLPECTAEQVRHFATRLQNEARDRWTEWGLASLGAATTRSGALGGEALAGSREDWQRQLDDTFEVYWVAVPAAGNYRDDYRRVAAAYDGRRHCRTFRALPHVPAFVGTCRQCGARPAVFRPRGATAGATRTLFNRRDQLCPVCLARRLWARDLGAVASTLALSRDRVFRMPAFHPIVSGLRDLGIAQRDDQLDFLEWLQDVAASPGPAGHRNPPDAAEEDRTRRFEAARRRLAADPERPDPSGSDPLGAFGQLAPYYAILVIDGDEMGRWLGGERFASSANFSSNQHELGSALAAFAVALRTVVPDRGGHLIYAGGDDAFMMSPLDAALPLLAAIRAAWETKVAQPLTEVSLAGHRPTFSAHLSLVHEHAPLQAAVRRLQDLLARTKELGRRNAFSLLADVRAGEPILFVDKLDRLDELIEVVESFTSWRRSHMAPDAGGVPPDANELLRRRRSRFAGRLPHKLAAATAGFFDDDGHCVSHDGIRREIQRLLVRDNADAPEHARARLARWAAHRYDVREDRWSDPALTPRDMWLSGLEAIAFLARVLDWPAAAAEAPTALPMHS